MYTPMVVMCKRLIIFLTSFQHVTNFVLFYAAHMMLAYVPVGNSQLHFSLVIDVFFLVNLKLPSHYIWSLKC